MSIDFASLDAIIIESIHAEATYNSTGKVRQYGAAHNVSGTIHTEGQLFGYLTALYPSLLILEVPRFNILKAYFGRHPYTKGDKVDNIVKAMLKRTLAAHLGRNALLSTPDKRDAYLAALHPALPLTLGIDPAATLATSTWLLQRNALPLATGKCDALLT